MKYLRPYKCKQTSTVSMLLKIASAGVFIASLCIMYDNRDYGFKTALLSAVSFLVMGFFMLGLSEVVALLNKIANQSYILSEKDEDKEEKASWEGMEPIYKKSPGDEYKV